MTILNSSNLLVSTYSLNMTRTIPPQLVRRYPDEGWWNTQTLGEVLALGLAESADLPFRVHSAVGALVGHVRRLDGVLRAEVAACSNLRI